MADEVPPGAGSEQPETSARTLNDDESLKNAMAALLGLRSEAPRSASSLSIPPPRRPEPSGEPLPEPPPDLGRRSADAPLAAAFADRPESGPHDFWSRVDPTTRAGEDPVTEAPAPVLDAPDPLLDAPAPRLDAPAPLLGAADDAATRRPHRSRRFDSSADDFWASPAPVGPIDVGEAPDTGTTERTPSSLDDRSSVAALQEAGLGGPLNTAIDDLRRLSPEGDDRAARPPPLPPPVARSARPPLGGRAAELQAWWASRGRELVPGLAVALLVVLAFAVVLIARGGDDRDSRADAADRSTTVPTTSTLPPLEGDPVLVPPFEEPGLDEPSEPPPAAAPWSSGGVDADDPAPAARRSRPRAAAPQPAARAPAPAPRAASPGPAPTSPPPTLAPTTPPATTAPSTTQPSPRPSDPCDNPVFTPDARQRCLDSLGSDD